MIWKCFPTSPTVSRTPRYNLPPVRRASQRNTGAVLLPFTVPTLMRPTGCGWAPNNANAPAAEITHTGSPRKERQFPLSANPCHRTLHSPADNSHAKIFLCMRRYFQNARAAAVTRTANIPNPVITSETGARSR